MKYIVLPILRLIIFLIKTRKDFDFLVVNIKNFNINNFPTTRLETKIY
jgi:hypothetical protein